MMRLLRAIFPRMTWFGIVVYQACFLGALWGASRDDDTVAIVGLIGCTIAIFLGRRRHDEKP